MARLARRAGGRDAARETDPPAGRRAAERPDRKGTDLGRLFGEMWGGNGTAGEQLEDGDDWVDLLAVHSVGSMLWPDAGDLYLLARRSAVARLDFAEVLATVGPT